MKFNLQQKKPDRRLRKKIRRFNFSLHTWSFCALLLLSSFCVKAQNITIKVKNESLEKVLKEVAKQANYEFFYNPSVLKEANPVTINVKNTPLREVLNLIFSSQKLKYSIKSQTIVVSSAETDNRDIDFSHQRSIYGQITDEQGNPLWGVSIFVKEKNLKVISDVAGNYTIEVGSQQNTISFSYVGMITQQLSVPLEMEKLNITMVAAQQNLKEIVITGYQTLSKERATGSFSTMNSEKLQALSSLSLADKIKGKVSGLLIDTRTPDGTFLYRNDPTKNSIRLHGENTFQIESVVAKKPLIVVDGFPTNDDISTFNPEDIENITILKDAAAASIWGAQAANGVIVLQTKRGKSQKELSINYSSTFSVAAKPRLSYLKLMNASQLIDFEQDLIDAGKITDHYYSDISFSKSNSAAAELIFSEKRGQITADQRDAGLNLLRNRDVNKQINKYLLTEAASQQHNLSLSGGSDIHKFFYSLSYAHEQPNIDQVSANRFTVLANDDFKLGKRFTLSTGINVRRLINKENGIGLNAISSPGQPGLLPYDQITDDKGQRVQQYYALYKDRINELTDLGYRPWSYNVLDELDNADNTVEDQITRLTFNLNTKIVDGLTMDLTFSNDNSTSKSSNLYNNNSYTARNLGNIFTSIDSDGDLKSAFKEGILKENYSFVKAYNLRGQLNYTKTFSEKHNLAFIGGAEIKKEHTLARGNSYYGYNDQVLSYSAIDYLTPYMTVYGYPSQFTTGQSIYDSELRYYSYYSNGSYNFDDRYTVTGSIRIDDYNFFGRNSSNNPKPMWSTGASWRISKEKFMESVTWVNLLALRATYGFTGNVAKGVFPYTSFNIGSYPDPYTNELAASVYSPANPNLTWERSRTINLGLDFAVLKSRLSGSFDVYWKNNSNLIANDYNINPTNGFSNMISNVASLKGKGVDLSLNGVFVRNDNFQLSMNATIAYNVDEVEDALFTNDSFSFSGKPIKGYPLNYLFAYKWAGLDSEGRSQVYNKNGEIVSYNNNDYTYNLDRNDMKYMGQTTPKYFGGATLSSSYKNWDFSITTSYKFGYVFRYNKLENYPVYSGFDGYPLENTIAQRWRQPGDENTTNVPGLIDIDYNSLEHYQNADINVLDGSQIRFDQVQLSFRVPSQMLGRSFIKQLKFGLSAHNLGVIVWNKEGIDPDYQPSLAAGALPPSRSYLFAINMNL